MRISRLKDKFTRAYDYHWTGELFKIVAVYKRNGLPVYNLQDWSDHAIKGAFYESEISPAWEPEEGIYKIECVFKTRGRGNVQESLVNWFLWPESYTSWVKT